MLLTCLILIPLPMLFAVLMDSNLVKAKGFWKAVLYLPALTSVVISGTLFRLMFSEYDTGQLNVLMNALGLESQKWLKMHGTGGRAGISGLLALDGCQYALLFVRTEKHRQGTV